MPMFEEYTTLNFLVGNSPTDDDKGLGFQNDLQDAPSTSHVVNIR